MSTVTTAGPEYREIPLDQLHAGTNVRDADRGIDELAASIAEVGILEPLIVTPDGDGWEVLDGHRRLAGAHRAQRATAPCIVRAAVETEHERITLQLVANLQRDDLTPREEAVAFEQLTMAGLTAEQISKATGRKASDVADVVRLFVLPEPVRERTWGGQIPIEDAIALAAITDPERREWVEKFIGTPSFAWKASDNEWREEQKRRTAKAEKREQARKEREDYKAQVAAAKAAGDPIPPKPTKPVNTKSDYERAYAQERARENLITSAAKTAASIRVPWVRARLVELAGQTVVLPAALEALTSDIVADAEDWKYRDYLKALGINGKARPATAAALVVILASGAGLLSPRTDAWSWKTAKSAGPVLVRWLVDNLGYEPTPEELELASGDFGKPNARKAPAKKPAAKKAAAKKATPVKKAAPRSRATVLTPAKKATPRKRTPAKKATPAKAAAS